MAKALMIQGTMSGVGKSVLTAGLLRVFAGDGYRAAPFKSQNMALNSFVTHDGLEIGRAQAMQAEAAGIRPEVWMNPVLLKPLNDMGSQVIVNGRPVGNMQAGEYFARRTRLWPAILEAYGKLSKEYDIIVIEGAGSPAEINLKEHDIVNMGLAGAVKAPVVLVGDLDRGGVFAQLLGTCELLPEQERRLIRAFVYNKFRGDLSLLEPGVRMLTQRCGIPSAGVMPWIPLKIEEEDSLGLAESSFGREEGKLRAAVIRLPRISNFTDFLPIKERQEVTLCYADSPGQLHGADIIILPGSKSTVSDLQWLRESGLSEEILEAAAAGTPVLGICGGLQMLGRMITDPEGVEGPAGTSVPGLALLPVTTELGAEKICRNDCCTIEGAEGVFRPLNGLHAQGYEIHMGRTWEISGKNGEGGGIFFGKDNIFGTYLHGFLENDRILDGLLCAAAGERGAAADEGYRENDSVTYRQRREWEYDRLAEAVRQHLDLPFLYRILEEGVRQ